MHIYQLKSLVVRSEISFSNRLLQQIYDIVFLMFAKSSCLQLLPSGQHKVDELFTWNGLISRATSCSIVQ